ncbi:hypothetical protein MMC19_000176 [Ptychographa xylographoides]|nr:hypothetical protein [Ptychographa xylographoides]
MDVRYDVFIAPPKMQHAKITYATRNIMTMEMKAPGPSVMESNLNKSAPRIYISAESAVFDEQILRNWKDEGFQVFYLPYNGHNRKKQYIQQINHIADALGLGETYALVAYGNAATVALELCVKPMAKLCALVAFYPTEQPKTATGYPPGLEVVVHSAGSQKNPLNCKSYSYPDADIGFAERDLKEFDKVSSSLAWTRTLRIIRKGFGIEVDLEEVWENHLACESGAFITTRKLVLIILNSLLCTVEFVTKDADATMKTMVDEPYVNHIPTLTGGIGQKDLRRFYNDYFIPNNPPSMKMRLLSRTIGTDRVVDEMHVYFRHTLEIPWVLPGVEPTNKEVEVALVSVVCIRGGKLYHEHIYWDQATVLVQVGLLDPKFVPRGVSAKRLPVVDASGARKARDETSVNSNDLIEGW